MAEKRTQILPGDIVGHRIKTDLDYREVYSIGRDWLTLIFLDPDNPSEPLPMDNYEIIHEREGVL